MARKTTGVTCRQRKGVTYWFAYVDGQQVYCGSNAEGKAIAEAKRGEYLKKRVENRFKLAGMKVERLQFKRIIDLSNWYMGLPTVQNKKGYIRKVNACGHLMRYFGKKPINRATADDQEKYRQLRRQEGAANATINAEISTLSAMYNLAKKRDKISVDLVPGQFVLETDAPSRRRVTEDEYNRLLEHASVDFRDFLVCGYESAMRSAEICNLTASQVHLNVHHISGKVVDFIDLGIFDTKTGARRTVPVSGELKEVLKARLEGLGPESLSLPARASPFITGLCPMI